MNTTARVMALAALSVLVLSGCVKVDVNLTLNEDDTISGDYLVAVKDDLLGLVSGEDLGSAFGQDLIGGSTEEPYAAGGFTGTQTTFNDVPLNEYRDDTVTITREDDEYVVAGSTAGLTELTGDDPIPADAQATLSVTFPGPVSVDNGTLEGTTVTWNLLDAPAQLEARGAASTDDGGFPVWIIVVVFVLIGIGVGITVVLMSSTKRKAPESEQSLMAEYEAGILTHDTGDSSVDLPENAAPREDEDPEQREK